MDECKPRGAGGNCFHGVDCGRAVQVDPMKPKLKPPGTKRLKLNCDVLLSTSAFKFNLRRYIVVDGKTYYKVGSVSQSTQNGAILPKSHLTIEPFCPKSSSMWSHPTQSMESIVVDCTTYYKVGGVIAGMVFVMSWACMTK